MLLETDRKIREMPNKGSFITTINKKWAQANELKAGDKLKQLSLHTVTVLITPNSPLLETQNLDKFKQEMMKW